MPRINIYDYLGKDLYRIGGNAISESLSKSLISAGDIVSTLKEVAPENIGEGQTVTTISLTNPTITDFTNATHTHQTAAQGGVLSTAAITTGTLGVARGGVGIASYTQGDILYASGSTTISKLGKSLTATHYLSNTGTSNNPAWAQIDLSNGVTNTLVVGNGGTGAVTLTGLLQGNGTSAFTVIANSSTVGQVLRVTGASTYAWGALDLADTDAVTGLLPSANVTPAGSTTQVQFNNAGALAGDADFTFVTDTLTVAKLDVSGGVTRFQSTSTPASGKSLEVGYQDGGVEGYLVSYDRTAVAYKNLRLNDNLFLTANTHVGIGITPTAILHLKAGTASAETAPLKFVAGTNLTTPEAGAVEWNGTNLFITQSDGTRKTIAYV